MRLVLDNCIPRKFAKHIQGHEVASVVTLGWATLKDGALLDVIAGNYDVLITVDKSMPFQQRLDHRPFAVVVLRARSNRLVHLVPLVPQLAACLDELQPGEVREISTPLQP